MKVIQEWLERCIAMLPVLAEMGKQKWNAGIFTVMLAVCDVVLGWVGD